MSPSSDDLQKDDKASLIDKMCVHVNKSYGTEGHATFTSALYNSSDVVVDYEPLKLSTFRVFTAMRGTVFHDWVIFLEQVLITALFLICAVPMYIYYNQQAHDIGGIEAGKDSFRQKLAEQSDRMRDFAMAMTVLASLLLSFYTAMAVSRWWAIRTAGIGGIKAAAVELEMMISQMCTQDPQVLEAIRRYARASLILVFIWRHKRLSALKADLVPHLLTEDEAEQMLRWNHCLHETVWAWQSAIVATLHQEGKIRSDQLFRALLERCSDGRKAVQVIHTHLAVKIPMQYVHLLGVLVKMHNLVLAVIMGSLFGAAVRNGEIIICVQLFGRTLILPLLFNAILLINAELSDPFDGHPTDFPGHALSAALEKDGQSFVKASQNMPDWMARRNPLPV